MTARRPPQPQWHYTGQQRPSFAEVPGPGQESVWDYPRPPRLLRVSAEVVVQAAGRTIARSARALRVQETAAPPTYYVPLADIAAQALVRVAGSSVCEWKGVAEYWALAARADNEAVAWRYPEPSAAYSALRGHFGFYPGRVACYLGGERVRPQAGYFYAGWITDNVVGPFKGEPGSESW